MELICNSCSKKIIIPGEKVPRGKLFHITCPQCKTKISVAPESSVRQPDEMPLEIPEAAAPTPGSASRITDEGDQLDFIEEGEKSALVCDQENSKLIVAALEGFGYKLRIPKSPEDAINRIRYTVYDLIILNEKFGCADIGGNSVLQYLQPMPMNIRRKIVLMLIGERFRTLDNMEAFGHSVNGVVNKKDLSRLTAIMKKYLQGHERFYKIYNESLKKMGKD